MRKMILMLKAMSLAVLMLIVGCTGSAYGEEVSPSGSIIPTEAVKTMSEDSSADAASFDWTDITVTRTDEDGYVWKSTFHVSPWIFNTNTDILNATWEEVGTGQPLPGIDEIGLSKSGELYDSNWDAYSQYSGSPFTYADSAFMGVKADSYYYCLGSVKIENLTQGWDFSEADPFTAYSAMPWDFEGRSYTGSSCVGRVYFSDGTVAENHNGGVCLWASMVSNNWGPVPFILVTGDKFTPNNPDGEYYEGIRDGYFPFYSDTPNIVDCNTTGTKGQREDTYGRKYWCFYTGVIGKDGIYAPAEVE